MLGLDSFSSKACMGKGSHQKENLETVTRGRGQNDSGWQVLANAHWREEEVISGGYPMKLNSLPNEHLLLSYGGRNLESKCGLKDKKCGHHSSWGT